jgi:hypothetical protein
MRMIKMILNIIIDIRLIIVPVGVDGEDGVEVEEVEMGAWGVQAEHE